jgi:dihydroflavonol-4-reductase
MKVAVTGAAGFVGTNLVNLLVEQGNEVVAIDRAQPETETRAQVTWLNANILEEQQLEAAFQGVDVVYHLVAMITLAHQDELAWRINTEGVRNVAEAALAAGVRRMVHCSSIHSFDQYACGGNINEETARSVGADLPVYDRSKFAGEQELRAVIEKGLDAVICNPTAVYGPVDKAPLSRINGILRDAARGRVPAFVEGGFDFVDVRDVAAGLVLAGEKGRTGENYLLTGQFLPMVQVCRMAARLNGRRGPLFSVPLKAVSAIVPIAEPICKVFKSDVITRASIGALESSPHVDGNKARSELGYTPRDTDTTIRDLIAHFVTSGQLQR